MSAFKPVVADASQSTVRVMSSGRDVALGTVVGADGWIVTKYSELREPLLCRLSDGKQLPAKMVGEDAKLRSGDAENRRQRFETRPMVGR